MPGWRRGVHYPPDLTANSSYVKYVVYRRIFGWGRPEDFELAATISYKNESVHA